MSVVETVVVSDDSDVQEVAVDTAATVAKTKRVRMSHKDDQFFLDLSRRTPSGSLLGVCAALKRPVSIEKATRAIQRARVRSAKCLRRGSGCSGPRFLFINARLESFYTNLEAPSTPNELADEYIRIVRAWNEQEKKVRSPVKHPTAMIIPPGVPPPAIARQLHFEMPKRTSANTSKRLRACASYIGANDILEVLAKRGICTCKQFSTLIVKEKTGPHKNCVTVAGDAIPSTEKLFLLYILKLQELIQNKHAHTMEDDIVL
jgi:hypothetical protein